MEKHILRKKIFSLVEKTTRTEMEDLQKEEVLIQDNISKNEKVIESKKNKIETMTSSLFVDASEGSLNLDLFSQQRDYLVLLQDELMRDKLVAKSLAKRHQVQMGKVKEKYQKTKLYEKMINKSDVEIRSHHFKREEKESEELASRIKLEGVTND